MAYSQISLVLFECEAVRCSDQHLPIHRCVLTLDPNNAGIDVFKPPGKPKENGKSPINGVLKLEKKHLQMVHVPSQCSFTEQVQRIGACKSQPITKTKAIDLSKPHAEDIKMIDITVTATTQLAHTYMHACMHTYKDTHVAILYLLGTKDWLDPKHGTFPVWC